MSCKSIVPTHLLGVPTALLTSGSNSEDALEIQTFAADRLIARCEFSEAFKDALNYWCEARVAAGGDIPWIGDLAHLFTSALSNFVNVIDVSHENPDRYLISRGSHAAAIRHDTPRTFRPLSLLAKPLRDKQIISLFSAKQRHEPVLQTVFRRTNECLDDYARLLIPTASRPGRSKPDLLLSIYDYPNGFRAPRMERPASRNLTFHPAMLRR